MILDYNKLIIFSYPRAGTHLLASVLEQFGYHNYGDWYDTWTSDIDIFSYRSYKRSPDKIIKQYESAKLFRSPYMHTSSVISRSMLWKDQFEKSTITIWGDNLESLPMLLLKHKDSHWICPRRNKFDQLLSWCIVRNNKDINGEISSKSIKISEDFFISNFWKLHKVYDQQDFLVNNNMGSYIEFDELITKKFTGFNKEYSINTKDEHLNLESFIENIDNIKNLFNYLSKLKTKM